MNYKAKRILKYLIRNMDKTLTCSMVKEHFKLSKMDFVKLIRPLYNEDIIVITDNDEVYATKYSEFYLKQLRRKLYSNLFWSLFIPIVVSIITTLTTIWITQLLTLE